MKTILAILACLSVIAGCRSEAAFDRPEPQNGPWVKLIVGEGTGSGTHIGGGFILSAGHVVGKEKTVKIKFEDGQIAEARVLWADPPDGTLENKAADIALLRYADRGQAKEANLSCRELRDGEAILAHGNPADQDNLTMRGFVAGEARQYGPWQMVTPTDLTLISGMSGGGIFDAGGQLVGVSVGTMVLRLSMFPAWGRVGYVVPGRTVCDLLARVA